MKKVKSGDPLRIPSSTFNTFIDSAQDFLNRQQSTGQKPTQAFRQTGIVLVKNNSGADRGRFDVLGLDGPIFTPSDSLWSFKKTVAFKGVTPVIADHTGLFVILQEPLAAGEFGRAVISGVTVVKVDISDVDHRYADVKDGDCGMLASSAASGSAQIIYKRNELSQRWLIVRIGNAPATLPVLLTKDGGVAGGEFSECTYTYSVKALDDWTVLAAEITPQRSRLHYTEYWYAGETRDAPATATSRYGLATYSAAGDLIVLEAFGEIAKN